MKKIVFLAFFSFISSVFAQKKSKTLVVINEEKITVSDFKRVYEKNLDVIDNEEAKDVKKNLDLYINYKLKVREAYRLELDTLLSYKKEIETYKNQLSAPYLQDSSFINKLVKDVYFRTLNEIKVKHILIRTPKIATPKDTLIAYQKIMKIRDRIIEGEDFEKVAVEVSEDESARDNPKKRRKGNSGNLGYFSAFRMVYPFENAAYNTKIGKISKPFKTSFGYHILKVDDIRKSRGEIEVAHILINNKDAKAEKLINDIYNKLENDEQFKTLAKKYSNDLGSKPKGGKLRKFGSGVMEKSFEDVAFSIKNEEEYSKPFKTKFGWHIVQLIKKHPIKPFKEIERELKNKVRSSERAQLSQKIVIDKLKKNYQVVENTEAKKIFNRKDIRLINKDSLQAVILTINEKKIKQLDFIKFIKRKNNVAIYQLFNEFKNQEILAYYKENLEKSEPEFAYVINEYKEGLLLFELMQQKIWNKASKDTIGLKKYFEKNINNYQTKTLKKIKGDVMNDYQNSIEKNWISDLRKKSTININKKALKKLIKFYNN